MMITSLCFQTNQIRYGPYGSESASGFAYAGKGGVILGFHGPADKYIKAIGIYVILKSQLLCRNSTLKNNSTHELCCKKAGLGGKPWDDWVFFHVKQVQIEWLTAGDCIAGTTHCLPKLLPTVCTKNFGYSYFLYKFIKKLTASISRYCVVFDPLDGSSNIECGVSIGTPGKEMLAAGYCMYGSSCTLVLSTGSGVNGFTIDPSLGEFILTHPDIKIPKKGKIYSVNEGNAKNWDGPTAKYVERCKYPTDGSPAKSLR
ncbi:hypothetical protein LXL04_011923 [Taraxacum kok-saghyz]